jgi:hypothetical protein
MVVYARRCYKALLERSFSIEAAHDIFYIAPQKAADRIGKEAMWHGYHKLVETTYRTARSVLLTNS